MIFINDKTKLSTYHVLLIGIDHDPPGCNSLGWWWLPAPLFEFCFKGSVTVPAAQQRGNENGGNYPPSPPPYGVIFKGDQR
jgi:hypothetical protein